MAQENSNQTQQSQRAKISGTLSFIHIIAGSSLWVKSIIVSAALAAGYGSVLYYKGQNAISDVAEEVVQQETGITINFAESKPE